MTKEMAIFANVKMYDEVTFNDNGMIERGAVTRLTKTTFTVTALRCFDNNGTQSWYEHNFVFRKSNGNKAHNNHTYGNAIAIVGNFN